MKKYFFAAFLIVLSMTSIAHAEGVISTLDSVIVPDGNISIIPEEKHETENGLTLSFGYVTNMQNFAILAKNITFENENIDIDIIVSPNSTWTYTRINGVMIIPKTPSVIDAKKTSFYKTSRQLHVSFDATDEADIYFNMYGSPQIVVADTNIKWGFDNGRLNIKSNDIMKEIDVYWTNEVNDTVFVMDRRKAESIEHRIRNLVKELPKVNGILIKLREKNDELKGNLFSLESRIKAVSGERDKLRDTLAQTNRTAVQMESKVTGNVLVSQPAFALSIIITIISIMVLFDVLFLKRKGVQHE